MRRTSPIATLTVSVLAMLSLAACGDDGSEPVAQPSDPTTEPTTGSTDPSTDPSDPAAGGYEHPTGPDDAVVTIAQEGGFTTPEMMFARVPTLLVSGDGRQFSPGPQLAIYPGPLLPNVQVADIGEEGIQELLALADEHGLLQDREYPAPTNIADATDTVVTIRVAGEMYVHRAYALGLEDGVDATGAPLDDPARRELAAFVDAAGSAVVSDTVTFEPDAFLVRATPVDDLGAYDVEPTVVPWPAGVDVELGAAECVVVSADAVGDVFADANQLTFFEQDGVPHQLAVTPQLPGTGC
jgi:hypothetical protein